jgi:predicted nuclease with TOPRIM domain
MNFQIGDDILDSRDIEKRIDELEDLEVDFDEVRDNYIEAIKEGEELDDLQQEFASAVRYFDSADRQELNELRDFRSELKGYCDWIHGEPLIHERHKQEHAKQLAEVKDTHWPLSHIDWEAATNELFDDYHDADIDGNTYYVRCC